MRVLVYPHDLAMGGSQLNAIDLAASVRDRGHHVVVAGQPGPLVAYIDSLGLAFAPLPVPHRRPSSAVMRELRAITAREQLDVVHGYEWPPGLEAYLGVEARDRVPSVCTVMSMSVAPFLPRHQPLIVGTRQIRESVRSRPGPVHVIEPPVDTAKDTRTAPGLARAVDRLRSDHGLSAGELTVVVVSRLARELKLEGLLAAVDVVADLAAEFPVRLLVVGDGAARRAVADRAAAANERTGTRAVVLAGALTDPRPAYAAADVVLGMGSSILRGMAFGTAAIVQGEDGFWEALTPQTADVFRWQGWYGCGQVTGRPGGPPAGPDRLRFLLRPLLASSALRRELGMFSRDLVCAEFSLVAMAQRQEAIYHGVVEAGPAQGRVPDSARSMAGLGGYKAHRKWQRWRNRAPEDDFNAKARLPGPTMPVRARAVPAAGSGRKPMTNIPLVDLGAQQRQIADEVAAGWARVCTATAFIEGPDVRAFEEEFARFSAVGHCVGAANGTDAIEMALRAAGAGPGDEVILPANTFIATAEAVARCGARPVLADADPETLLVDPQSVESVIGPRTRVLLPVHLYGQMAPMAALRKLAEKHDLILIEDAAQAQGARQDGVGSGAGSYAAATSFYPGKNLGAFGDAGAVLTDDPDVARRIRMIGSHGSDAKYRHPVFGFNSRLDTLQAVVLRAKLRRLAGWNEGRRRAAARYRDLLRDVPDVGLPVTAPGNEHVWHLFTVRVSRRDEVLAQLQAEGIGAGIHYPVPVHLHGAFPGLGRAGSYPVAEAAATEILSLPLFPEITEEQQVRVVTALRSAVAR